MRSDGKKNVYESIVGEWKALIDVGAWREGDKLPSVRTYAMERKVNPNTVAKAYAALEEEGYIVVQLKKGAYVVKRQANETECRTDVLLQVQKWQQEGVTAAQIQEAIEKVFKE